MERWFEPVRPIGLTVKSHLALLFKTYDALNARNADAALATMTRDVEWPDLWTDEGWIVGHEALRSHYERHWARLAPRFLVQGYLRLPDERLRLEVRHSVHTHAGELVSNEASGHVYTFRDELIARMETA